MRKFFRIFIILKTAKTFGLQDQPVFFIRLFFNLFFFFQKSNKKVTKLRYGERLAQACEKLGPVFIKFGQLLSIRSDLVGEAISFDLMKLQDKCAFTPFEQIKKTIESEFETSIDAIFSSFDKDPIASASIAQVHFGVLKDGQKVAVKIVKPGIKNQIKSDVAILKALSSAFDWFNRNRGIETRNLINQFEAMIYRELDMRMEAANMSHMGSKLNLIEWVKVPEIYWKFVREKVLVMEQVFGISINEIEKIDKLGVDKELLAHRGLELVLRQIFQHNFFHADLHPGNILINKNNQFALVDFGLVGCLNAADKNYLAENYLAFFKRDYAKVVQNHIQSGWVPPDTNEIEFQAYLRMVIEPLSQKSLEDISMAKLLMTLFIVAQKFNMKVPHELALVDKTLLQIESMGRRLNPHIDVWKVMEPLIQEFVTEQSKPIHSIDEFKTKINNSIRVLVDLYPNIDRYLKNQDKVIANKYQKKPILNQIFLSSLVGGILGAGFVAMLFFF